jgi:long-chain acyl-CoA synthetase
MKIDLDHLADPQAGWRALEEVSLEDLFAAAEQLLSGLPAGGLDPIPVFPLLPPDAADGAPDRGSSEDAGSGESWAPLSGPHGRARRLLWTWLDATRRVPFLRRVAGTPSSDRWLAVVLEIMERTHYTTGVLFRQRVARDPQRPWLRIVHRDRIDEITLAAAAARVEQIARGLHALFATPPAGRPVAVLAENSPETIFCDLACLTTGVVNTTIPADATGEQAAWILEQVEAEVLFVGSDPQWEKMRPLVADLPALRRVVRILSGPAGPGAGGHVGVPLTLEELVQRGGDLSEPAWLRSRPGPRLGDPATVMYTSGTTGQPKGIVFSNRNIVFKRFCRALALPEIGESDRFLCYLPLFHTFGRWLEMTGSLFLGATYAFAENPSLEALLDNFPRVAPTVFISIPKKWIQLHDRIRSDMPEDADPRFARALVERVTGGRLRWGLSAAGFLEPGVFRFFQRHGVELMSGFGMTEATGGITMTPPGAYREGTVGRALPGIEVRRAEDGELLARGPYVMQGYFGPEEGGHDYRTDWFATGDIVTMEDTGDIAIVDRKKDIYKNVRGQTIAPQRVEGLFASFPEIRVAFLVGDGREYNTLLLYPDPEAGSPPLGTLSPDRLREYLTDVIVSVNGFLAPFERVLDFGVLPRLLTLEDGELTPKGTFRRKVVEEHFLGLINEMYRAQVTRLSAGELEVRVPHWWLREVGLTVGEVVAEAGELRLPRLGRTLPLSWDSARAAFRCGDLIYEGCGPRVDLETILRAPALWLGNHALVEFAGRGGLNRPWRRPRAGQTSAEGDVSARRPQPRRGDTAPGGQSRRADGDGLLGVAGMAAVPQLTADDHARLDDAIWRDDRTPGALHLAAAALLSADEKDGLRVVGYLESVAAEEDAQRSELARIPLRRAVHHELSSIRSAAFRSLMPHGAPEMVAPTMIAFLQADAAVLSTAGSEALSRRGLPDDVMVAVMAFMAQVHAARGARRREPARGVRRRRRTAGEDSFAERLEDSETVRVFDERRTLALLGFLVRYAGDHPGWYKAARQELARWFLSDETPRVREAARRGLLKLTDEFRVWLGPEPRVAVDPFTGREYGWKQVLRFDPGTDAAAAEQLSRAVGEVPLVKEAIFVLFGGIRVSLAEIPEGGVRVRHLGTRHGKAVMRLSVQTRQSGAFELAVNLARGMEPEVMEDEALRLVALGAQDGSRRVVEELGGYWPAQELWSEEFVPGDTVAALLARECAGPVAAPRERLIPLWIHLAASAVTLYLEFWDRTGRKLVPSRPAPENLIVPAHDDQEGARLVSISERQPFEGLSTFLHALQTGLVDPVETRYPVLSGVVGAEIYFAAVVDVFGEAEGEALLAGLAADADFARLFPDEGERLEAFRARLREGRYLPRRLAAAIRRYHRWDAANPGATPPAAARMLRDLWDSYGLRELEALRPETRLRLFRETVFASASGPLGETIDRLAASARAGYPMVETLLREMSELVRRSSLSEDEVYFLARLTYGHLRPEETADFALVERDGTKVSDLVVTHRDRTGRYFRVRHAGHPREVWALNRLFDTAGVRVRFRPGHQFLVAVDENARVLGGLVYQAPEGDEVHMEKIVVAPSHRRQGISEQLMEDFFRRMQSRGARAVTTGFFRPEYFRRFRFRVDREHAGLVRILNDEPVPEI